MLSCYHFSFLQNMHRFLFTVMLYKKYCMISSYRMKRKIIQTIIHSRETITQTHEVEQQKLQGIYT